MNEYMSNWELKEMSDAMIMRAIHEVERDHLASTCGGYISFRFERWLLLMMMMVVIVAGTVMLVAF